MSLNDISNLQQVAEDGLHWMANGPEKPLAKGPTTVTVEITTRCNLACVMCPHGLPTDVMIKRDAPDRIVDMLIQSIDSLTEVHPTGVGEPMLADGFWKIVEALENKPSPKLVFHTNGILLTERNIQRLASVTIGRVNISVDAADPLTYRQIRGADMRKTTDGIRRLVKALEVRGPEAKKSVAMSMVLMRENISEAAEFVRLAHSLGVHHVYFEHLTKNTNEHSAWDWTVDRDNFRFVYKEQELYEAPEIADRHILEAMDVADDLHVVIEGYQVLLLAKNKKHELRPCRTGAFGAPRVK
jgi:MoaA/NifB/PqqE/SkfB family radical SAM enzyme